MIVYECDNLIYEPDRVRARLFLCRPNESAVVLYLLAIVFPPAAIMMRGRIFQAWLSAALWAIALVSILVGIGIYAGPLCIGHGLFVVYWYGKDDRAQRESGEQNP